MRGRGERVKDERVRGVCGVRSWDCDAHYYVCLH